MSDYGSFSARGASETGAESARENGLDAFARFLGYLVMVLGALGALYWGLWLLENTLPGKFVSAALAWCFLGLALINGAKRLWRKNRP